LKLVVRPVAEDCQPRVVFLVGAEQADVADEESTGSTDGYGYTDFLYVLGGGEKL